MNESLYLHVPDYEELWYRKKIMQDPDTMSYNKGKLTACEIMQ